eukprot:TRINITY_DN15914_c0_g1_i2.p2 TRINITY_DN15914_c0_g1~~TRINITY_DN15914_c0_g1_i2.p2  ORF type:complete len:163 (-),score=9.02 TRINITY_DN15914_c0_g1_i2:123-611(-)
MMRSSWGAVAADDAAAFVGPGPGVATGRCSQAHGRLLTGGLTLDVADSSLLLPPIRGAPGAWRPLGASPSSRCRRGSWRAATCNVTRLRGSSKRHGRRRTRAGWRRSPGIRRSAGRRTSGTAFFGFSLPQPKVPEAPLCLPPDECKPMPLPFLSRTLPAPNR